MKTITTTIFGLIISLISISLAYAQSDFEGSITYDVTIENLPEDQPQLQNFLPTEMKVFVKDNKTCVEQKMGGSGGKNIVVSDYENMNGFIAMNMMGQNMLILIDENSFKENVDKNKKIDFEELNETKDILGYTCHKAKLTNQGVEIIVFYTKKLPNRMGQELMSLPGMPLQYEISMENMSMKFLAKNVNKGSVDNSVFDKPDGYQEMNIQDIKNMGMGNFKY